MGRVNPVVGTTLVGTVVGAVVGTALAVCVLPAPAWSMAVGGDSDRGHCTARSEWRLKADRHDGRIRVEGQVRTAAEGRRWRWRILHDGDTSFRGRATTGSDGSFRVRRELVDVSGRDRIGWRAVNRRTGERCRGGLTY